MNNSNLKTFLVTLSSVDNKEDTTTLDIKATSAEQAIALAATEMPYLYTGLVECKEAGPVGYSQFEDDHGMCEACFYGIDDIPCGVDVPCTCTDKLKETPIVTTNEGIKTMTKIDMTKVNKSAFLSTIAAMIHSNGQTPIDSMLVGAALMANLEFLGTCTIEEWVSEVTENLETASATVSGTAYAPTDGIKANWFDILVHANLISREGNPGTKLVDMILQTEKAYPAYASQGVSRRFPIKPFHSVHKKVSETSMLGHAAIGVLQKTEYFVDEQMMAVAQEVSRRTGSDDERYVLDGCLELVNQGNTARVSEFKMDRRERMNQSDCHGPNGQASDRSRALMNLWNVPTDYNIELAIGAVLGEMKDMTKDVKVSLARLMEIGAVAFIIESEAKPKFRSSASKPWSFVKAAIILAKLRRGERPYIGMAFGLDAKCSGPQIGAILTGDRELAAACGFGNVQAMYDAYERAIKVCEEDGIRGLDRGLIKKAYMGVFYGQGAAAFGSEDNYGTQPKQHNPDLLLVIKSIGGVEPREEETLLEAQAKKFHSCIERSFGKVQQLRKAMRAAHYHFEEVDGYKQMVMDTTEPTMHRMPSGSYISMDYRVKVDIMGDVVSYDSEPADVTINIEGYTQTFSNKTFKTKEYALYDHARSGFVNMIQGMDAQVAQHVIVEADLLGCQHVLSVHDCFRVNICDFLDGKLHAAIERAYFNLFGSGAKGYDVLDEYFKGVEAAGGNTIGSQITTSRKANGASKLSRFGLDVDDIINNLENAVTGKQGAYYFAK